MANSFESELREIESLREFLLHLPTPLPNGVHIAPSSVSIRAAVAGLDKERARLERDNRLVEKFAAVNSAGKKEAHSDVSMDEYVQMSKEDVPAPELQTFEEDDSDDWEDTNADVSPKKQRSGTSRDEECQRLASSVVSRIASSNTVVATPLGALALALHTSLTELSTLDNESIFRCTGVPDESVTSQFVGVTGKKTGGGFAPPIRELPSGQLVPKKWEDKVEPQNLVIFRYKCGCGVYSVNSGPTTDASTVYLALQQRGDEVTVSFGALPASNASAHSSMRKLVIQLSSAINLDGFQKASSKCAVSPTLFFISLPSLLGDFCTTFELLPSTQQQKKDTMAVETVTSIPIPHAIAPRDNTKQPDVHKEIDSHMKGPGGISDPLRVVNPAAGPRRGDFDSDMLPGFAAPSRGGNQVGPNHPMFDRTFGDGPGGLGDDLGPGGIPSFGIPGVGGMEMRPRFDPYGPPGLGGRGGRGRGRGRGGRGANGGFGGVPNPDHLRPPNDDYFS